MQLARTVRFHRRNLPHWEVEGGRYFVTVRCGDSLPRHVVDQLDEVHRTLQTIEPRSAQFAELQQYYFQAMEKYLDAGHGNCPLRNDDAAGCIIAELEELLEWAVEVPHYAVMPNHWHAMICPLPSCDFSLSAIMKRLKGRTGKALRAILGGEGAVWQREWFDRWMRDDAEYLASVAYIRDNPVKARLASTWRGYRWAK